MNAASCLIIEGTNAMETLPIRARERLGEMIRAAREREGISQLCLAAHLGLKNAQSISNIERGIALLPAHHLVATAKTLNISPFTLMKALLEAIEERLMEHLRS